MTNKDLDKEIISIPVGTYFNLKKDQIELKRLKKEFKIKEDK